MKELLSNQIGIRYGPVAGGAAVCLRARGVGGGCSRVGGGGWMLPGPGEEVLFVGLVPLIGERKLIWHAEARPQTVGAVFLWTAKRHCTKSKGGLEPPDESSRQRALLLMCLRK